ncbi:maleylacetate reductase [Microbacterium sp. UBA3394]|uniref:maleylacetate reductase n=2 Tax=Microbacterium TaxID=33882 RepID=UPI00257AE145|nr:maleylacetate reductase [Microbacterium sp. UBA3394]|tara:strand:- start:1254 stop:2348 length:1095 start_codon:yes stop_codon:yes gene_type:complete
MMSAQSTPLRFVHDALPQRVLFGAGAASEHVRDEVERLGARRVMVLASADEAQLVARAAGRIEPVLEWTEIAQHVPVDIAVAARAAAIEASVDLLVSVGGGSTTGMAKAIALETGLPIIAVPTTYAGSEATNVWGLTEAERKTTGVEPRVLPVSVVYDSELTLSLPVALSVASGLNGIAHCVDALWAPRADPINAALGAEAIRALAGGLRGIVADPQGLPGRDEALYGAYLAAVSFASAGSGLHHKICHALGGTYGLPHAQTHAVVLPYVTAFNVDSAPDAARRLQAAFGADDPLAGLVALREELDAPRALRDLGFEEASIEEAAEIILPSVPPTNPRPVAAADLVRILRAAWAGTDPAELRAR